MKYENIVFKKKDGIAKISLNQPDKLNALNTKMITELYEALHESGNDPEVRCIVLTGVGRGFCAGADAGDLGSKSVSEGAEDFGIRMERYNRVIRILRDMEKPIIASVNGVAVGGGMNLVLACDIRIASDSARFGEVFVKVGLSPDCGGGYLLWRLVGLGKATELMFTGDIIDAEEALKIGLVNRVVPGDELEKATADFAERMAKGPTRAIGLAKKILNRGMETDLATLLDFEAFAQYQTASSEDCHEGVRAFTERRDPEFKGR